MSTPHILTAFDNALEELRRQALDMNAGVNALVSKSFKAFKARDFGLAREVIQADLAIDAQHDALKAQVVDIIARFQPAARDLREVIAFERTVSSLERLADHAKSIAKRTIGSADARPKGATLDLLLKSFAMLEATLGRVETALKERNLEIADEVCAFDSDIDRICDDLMHSIVADIQQSPETAHDAALLILTAKSLERMGDYATNVAEEVRFMTLGEAASATRKQ